jgi:hypothetical protein
LKKIRRKFGERATSAMGLCEGKKKITDAGAIAAGFDEHFVKC